MSQINHAPEFIPFIKVDKKTAKKCHSISQISHAIQAHEAQAYCFNLLSVKSGHQTTPCTRVFPDLNDTIKMVPMKILAVDDEPAQAAFIRDSLIAEGFDVRGATRGAEAIRLLETDNFNLVVLDWNLPDISGLEVLAWIRARVGRDLPVLFLTNRVREEQLVIALDAGADDYMVKPVRRHELIARVRALLRRAYPVNATPTSINIGRYRLDLVTETAFLSDEPIKLTSREFNVAVALFQNCGRAMPREALIKSIWGRHSDHISRTLDTHIYRVRSKLRIGPENGVRLRAVYNHGYRLELLDPNLTHDAE
ncbi:response regulator transcription factor [Burkholderia cepacia]|uniref:response regulator transcription factor n=1 Tax=Burkholderia cepacia TaxID=292 RepID=UPI001CF16E8F|nr:response regulator transcription factor [Burkholderia cepacia]MCA7893436.1 response regulator transcription factor [Burkholderia cepacia]